MGNDNLLERIEELRRELKKLRENGKSMNQGKILETSEQLDVLINEYYKYNCG